MEKVVIEVDVMLMSSTSMFLPGKYSPVVVGVCEGLEIFGNVAQF